MQYKGKGKDHPWTDHEGPAGEYRYSSTLSFTSALDEMGGQHHAPTALPQGKTQYPLYRRLGGPQGRSGRMRKISLPPEFDPRTLQPVASRCTGSHKMYKIHVYLYIYIYIYILHSGPASSVGITTELRAGRSGIESRWGLDLPPFQTGPEAHPA